jgi:hypothetical protein
MPSFLFKEDPVEIPVYQHPMDLMGRALMVRDAKVKEGLSMIRSQYDNLLNTPLTNEVNRMGVKNDTEAAMSKLKGLSSVDLSLPENQGAALGVFDNVLNNKNYLTDMAFTRHIGKQKQIIEETRKKNPAQWSPQNEHQVTKAENAYRFADPNSEAPKFATFTPFVDVDKMYQDIAKNVEEEQLQQTGQRSVDGYGRLVVTNEIKEKTKEKILARFQAAMTQDPRIAQQMFVNYDYLKDSGVINPDYVIAKIETDIKRFTDNYITPAGVSDETKKAATAQVEGMQNAVKKIKQNPDSFSDVYGLGAFINDYMDETATGLAYRREGKVEYDPASLKMFENTLKSMEADKQLGRDKELETWKAQYSGKTKTGVNPTDHDARDPRGWGNSEFIQKLEKINKDGYLSTTEDDQFVKSILGNPTASKTIPGYYSLTRFGTETADPSKNVILSTAGVQLSKEDAKHITTASVLKDLESDILRITPKAFTSSITLQTPGSSIGGGLGSTNQNVTMQDGNKVKLKKINDILNSNDPKYNTIRQVYKDKLQKIGLDLSNPSAIADYSSYVSQPENAEKIFIGTTLNSLKGDFEFKPTGSGKTVEIGDNGQAFINGYIRVPMASVPESTRKLLIDNGVTLQVEKLTDEPDPKKTKSYYVFEGKVPTQIDLAEAGVNYSTAMGVKDPAELSYVRDQLQSYLGTSYNNDGELTAKKDNAGNTFFVINDQSEIRNDLRKVGNNLLELKNNGELDIDSFKVLYEDLNKINIAQFSTKAEALSTISSYLNNLGPRIKPESTSVMNIKTDNTRLDNALKNPASKTILDTLQTSGFTPKAAAFWLGNFIQESDLNPTAENKKELAFGIAQWRGDRRENLESFTGTKTPTIEQQVQFFMHELKGRVGEKEYERIKGLTDPVAIRKAIFDFERYGHEGNRTYFGHQIAEALSKP